ncbi:hypothetical protein EGW08_013873 [Elysia chlorotica]|uniref:Hexosyltransferase n=1 Tax=Elysia chlorotica TaxID=188477 RepID=A0A3S0ZGG2_ELYCH|nr:hypothetical protein EGW08_013873 [Elysia chlorotica]
MVFTKRKTILMLLIPLTICMFVMIKLQTVSLVPSWPNTIPVVRSLGSQFSLERSPSRFSPKNPEDIMPSKKAHISVSGAPSSLKLTQKKQPQNLSKGSAKDHPKLTTVTTKSSQNSLANKPSCSPLQNVTKPYFFYVTDDMSGINRTFFKLSDTKVSEIPMVFLSSATHICSQGARTIFVVPSVVASFEDRLEIRQTWASGLYDENWEQTSERRIAFFFGSSGLSATDMAELWYESDTFGDIVVGDFHDTYANLSLKMAVTISWVAKYCPNIDAMVKVDMDTFVNVDLLSTLLKELPVEAGLNYVLGHRYNDDRSPVMREGVWSVPQDVYPFDFYPQYLFGHSYLVSGSAVTLLAKSFPYFPIVPNEDAFVTGIMSLVLNNTRFDTLAFGDTTELDEVWKIENGISVTAVVYYENRKQIWHRIKSRQCKLI